MKANVAHIKNGAGILSKMKQVMKKVEEFGRDEKVRISEILWGGAQVTMLWSSIWGKLDPFLRTESRIIYNHAAAIDKIIKGEISWITC